MMQQQEQLNYNKTASEIVIQELKSDNEQLKRVIDEKSMKVEQLKKVLHERDLMIEKLKDKLVENQRLHEQIQTLEAKYNRRNSQLLQRMEQREEEKKKDEQLHLRLVSVKLINEDKFIGNNFKSFSGMRSGSDKQKREILKSKRNSQDLAEIENMKKEINEKDKMLSDLQREFDRMFEQLVSTKKKNQKTYTQQESPKNNLF